VVLQPSLTGHSKVVTHDVPVGVVPRRLWGDLAEPEMPDFDVCSSVIICSTAVVLTFKTMIWGYWRQRADKRFGDPPPKVNPGAFSGQRRGWKTPKRTPWQCTASVCVAGVHCWEISLGLADPGNVIFCLSCQFILGLSCAYSLCVVA